MEGNQGAIVVKIGLYSGMPNPEMKLTGETASQFAELVKSTLGREPIHPPPAPKLGEFYGFLVQVPQEKAKGLELPAQASVFSGVLTDMTQRKGAHWSDVAGIERFLIRLAYEQGFGELLEKVGVSKPE
jgi:hypothetical protein